MRISFLGKGGSGKTTLSAAYTRYVSKKYRAENVLAIDGDVNMHLAPLLGADQKWLHTFSSDIKKYLEPKLSEEGVPVVGSIPPTKDSKYVRLSAGDEFLNTYATHSLHNERVLTVGTYEAKDAGANCYHGKLQTLELLLHRTLDKKNQRVVCDMTAGIDSLGTSLYMASDCNVMVIEPTLKSVSVYKDFTEAAKTYGISTYAVANKIEDKEDEDFINSVIEKDAVLGFIHYSKAMKRYEQGSANVLDAFVKENEATLKCIDSKIAALGMNIPDYVAELDRIYRLNCEWWYDDFYGVELGKLAGEETNLAQKLATRTNT